MTKKLNRYTRKRLLEEEITGVSKSKLKTMFGIKDNRTLTRQLKLAMEEEQVSAVKSEIIKDALLAHLNEVGSLIDEWKGSISTPIAHSIYYDMSLIPTQEIEDKPLFSSVKEHLPFTILWRDYTVWKNKVRAFIEGCQKIMKEIGEAEKQSMPADTYKQWGTESTSKAMRLSEPLYEMMVRYKKTVKDDENLKALLKDLASIETKLHTKLQEIQLRRDHLMYNCKLCPGQSRLSR
ncbi:hypothetical protein ACFLWG_01945 [Chloroflexota bacterium]